jgi:hypothetical protein
MQGGRVFLLSGGVLKNSEEGAARHGRILAMAEVGGAWLECFLMPGWESGAGRVKLQ